MNAMPYTLFAMFAKRKTHINRMTMPKSLSPLIPSLRLIILLLSTGILSGPAFAEPLKVHVSVPPQAFLVEQIGGDYVTVRTLISKGQDPHTFEASPQQALGMGQAALYFTVNLPFEKRLVATLSSNNPQLKVVGTSHENHMQGADHHNAHRHHAMDDPHVWLDLKAVRDMAATIAASLSQIDPDHHDVYEQNLTALERRIEALSAKLTEQLAPYKGQAFYVFHPAFGHFAQAFGLEQKAVEIEGKSPSPRQLAKLIRKARQEKVKIIFTQPQYDPRSAQTIAQAIGGTAYTLDPLAKDLLTNIEHIAAKVAQGLRQNVP